MSEQVTPDAPDVAELIRRVEQLAGRVRMVAPVIEHDWPIAQVRGAVRSFIETIGWEGICKGCHATVYWIEHANGKRAPYTRLALNHFADCPEAAAFKRKRKSGATP